MLFSYSMVTSNVPDSDCSIILILVIMDPNQQVLDV